MKNKEFELGCEVKDLVSGWKGIITARCEFLNGCIQFGIRKKALKNETELKNTEFIDSAQLEYVGPGMLKKKKTPRKTGGPMTKDCPR